MISFLLFAFITIVVIGLMIYYGIIFLYSVQSSRMARKESQLQLSNNKSQKELLGNSGWNILHSSFEKYPENPTEENKSNIKKFIDSFSEIYPCEECSLHMKEYTTSNPLLIDNKETLTKWGFDFHNNVNKRLNKEEFTWDSYILKYRWTDCDECKINNKILI